MIKDVADRRVIETFVTGVERIADLHIAHGRRTKTR